MIGDLYVVPILHPAAVMRGRWAMSPIQTILLERAWALANGSADPPADASVLPEGCNIYPTTEEIYEWWKWYGKPEGCTADIECAGRHLVCVGFASLTSEHYICIRFRDKGGAIHGPTDLAERAHAMFNILADPDTKLVFHNGQAFDIPYLEDVGFVINGYDNDTMLQAHLTYAEHPKGLEFLASIYAEMPPWKHLVRDTDEPEGK